jgi:hypothetical protein
LQVVEVGFPGQRVIVVAGHEMRHFAAEVGPAGLYGSEIGIQGNRGELKPECVWNGGRVAPKGVAGEEIAGLLVKDNDRSGSVPRRIVDYEGTVAEVDTVPVVN